MAISEISNTVSVKFGNGATVATLHFKKSDQTDMYSFNRYNLSLKQRQSLDELSKHSM